METATNNEAPNYLSSMFKRLSQNDIRELSNTSKNLQWSEMLTKLDYLVIRLNSFFAGQYKIFLNCRLYPA